MNDDRNRAAELRYKAGYQRRVAKENGVILDNLERAVARRRAAIEASNRTADAYEAEADDLERGE